MRVPQALLSYMARRCEAPGHVLAALLGSTPPGRSQVIPSSGDIHRGIAPCGLSAVTLITCRSSGVEASIIGKDWTVRASTASTDLILARLPDAFRATSSHGLLCDRFDLAFLPRELQINKLVERGLGAMICCQPLTTILNAPPSGDEKVLNDVWGAVSGSDGAS